jgi:hypothetical protein
MRKVVTPGTLKSFVESTVAVEESVAEGVVPSVV